MPLKAGERFLQFVMRRQRAANQARRAGAGAEFFHRLDGGFLQQRVVGETEVIVGRKIQQRFAADLDARALRRIHAAQFAEQTLAADGVKALVQFCVKVSHAANFTIYDLRFTSKKPDRKMAVEIQRIILAEWPSARQSCWRSQGRSWASTVS